MENKERHDMNGIHGHCITYLNGYCMLRIGPEQCYNNGDYNKCPIRHPYNNKSDNNKTENELADTIRDIYENTPLKNLFTIDFQRISHDIMKKFIVRTRHNRGDD